MYNCLMDVRAVEEAYRTYAAHVYARCARILRDPDAARDVTQEVFLRCFKERLSLRPGRELLAWLYRVGTNLCLNLHRSHKVRLLAHAAEVAEERSIGPVDPRGALDLLSGLDERTQAVAIYVYIDGMTQAEAAAVAGVTDRTIRNCLTRFLTHTRKALGLTQEDDCHDALSVRLRAR